MDDAHFLAAFRRTFGTDLGALAEEHYRHDLTDSDRALLLRSASTLSVSATVGSLTGLTLGLLLALRLRRSRARLFTAFRTAQRPTSVTFADGRTEALPDITSLVKPTRVGDWDAAKRGIREDYDAKQRIEGAFRRFRAEVLRRQAEAVESGKGSVGF